MSKVEVPKLDWYERYKRMVDMAYSLFITAELQIHADFKDPEEAQPRIKALHGNCSSTCGSKLVKAHELKPTVEDALKLFMLYSCEVWGFGSYETVAVDLKNDNKGTFANLVCRGWELATRQGIVEELKKTNCSKGCTAEYEALLRTLSPDLKITMTKARPLGDDCCEFTVER